MTFLLAMTKEQFIFNERIWKSSEHVVRQKDFFVSTCVISNKEKRKGEKKRFFVYLFLFPLFFFSFLLFPFPSFFLLIVNKMRQKTIGFGAERVLKMSPSPIPPSRLLIFLSLFFSFLDAPSHLYKRLCPSVGRSVRRSVRPQLFSNAY